MLVAPCVQAEQTAPIAKAILNATEDDLLGVLERIEDVPRTKNSCC